MARSKGDVDTSGECTVILQNYAGMCTKFEQLRSYNKKVTGINF